MLRPPAPAQGKGLDVTLSAKAPEAARAAAGNWASRTFPGKKLGAATLNGTAQGPLDRLDAHVAASAWPAQRSISAALVGRQ
ncbi:MAG: hypothetical protein WDN29_08160 [Methylovirgula sp.]